MKYTFFFNGQTNLSLTAIEDIGKAHAKYGLPFLPPKEWTPKAGQENTGATLAYLRGYGKPPVHR